MLIIHHIYQVSSLGSGLDHVMDAISECEQLMRSRGKHEEDAPWRLYFRKELFVPWHNPEYCPASTELIYKQICKGIRTEEYKPRAVSHIVEYKPRAVSHIVEYKPRAVSHIVENYVHIFRQ